MSQTGELSQDSVSVDQPCYVIYVYVTYYVRTPSLARALRLIASDLVPRQTADYRLLVIPDKVSISVKSLDTILGHFRRAEPL